MKRMQLSTFIIDYSDFYERHTVDHQHKRNARKMQDDAVILALEAKGKTADMKSKRTIKDKSTSKYFKLVQSSSK